MVQWTVAVQSVVEAARERTVCDDSSAAPCKVDDGGSWTVGPFNDAAPHTDKQAGKWAGKQRCNAMRWAKAGEWESRRGTNGAYLQRIESM